MEPKESQTEKSLQYSIRDGIFASLMTGFTSDYFTPFILFLGGSVRHVGLLNALPNFVSSIIQLKSADISERFKSRKKVINFFVLLQALTLLPMLAIFFLGEVRVAVFIAIVTLFTSFGAFVNPAWASLMADLVQENRGRYFGWRNKVLGFVAIASTFTAGFILHRAEKFNLLLGFAAIFILAFIFRVVSWHYLRKMHEPSLEHKEGDYFSILEFISRINTSNFVRFVFYVSLLKFAANIAAPFFAVLMIRDLKYDYLTYTAITLSATLATNFSIKRWGMYSDKVGNLKIIKLTGRLVSLTPLLWMINQNPVYLFAVQLFSGFAWAGFNLSASNFIYDATTPAKRTRCIAYFNVFNGVSLCFGALLGGYLAQELTSNYFGWGLMNILLISSVLRFIVAFYPFHLKEVREVEKIRSHELLINMIKVKPDL